jgi:phage/plasmid-associated DNA primase
MSEYSSVLDILNSKTTNRVFTVINFNNNKKYGVDVSNVINFYKNYCESLNIKDLNHWDVHPIFALGEVTDDIMPIIGEFIFRFDGSITLEEDDEDGLYSRELVNGVVACFQETIKELFFLGSKGSELICCVSESRKWKQDGKICVKMKLQFPYCKTDRKFANTIFRSKVIQKLRQNKLNQLFIESTPIGDWDTHLEEVKNYYPFYGSTDNTKRPPCFFSGVFADQADDIPLERVYEYTTHQFISGDKCIIDQVEGLEDPDMERSDHKMFLLPIFLSLHFWSGVTQTKDEYHTNGRTNYLSSSIAGSEEEDEEYNENPTDFEICLEMIEMLSEKRFTMENYFLDIGRALHKSLDGDKEALDEWKKLILRKGLSYTDEFCEDKWVGFENDEITVKTLAWYANEDDREGYENWHERWCRPKILHSINNVKLDNVVAEAFYRVFWLRYMYTGKRWVEFEKSKLKLFSEDFRIRKVLTNGFIPCFDKLRAGLSEEKLRLNPEGKKAKELNELINQTGTLINELQKERYRTTLVKSLKEYFFKENLGKILNKNPNLLGCGNCVIEVNDNEAFTRNGKPEDYITKSVGVHYQSIYSMSHPDVKALLKYMEQVFPEPSINHHMRKDIASMLFGRNAEKCFRMWIGDTNGSKSVYQKMITKMLGEYACDLPATFFSAQQRGGSGPNPELAQTAGARVAFSAEPDDDTSFKGARIKRLTGGDSFYARSCNEDGGSIETSFKNVMVLNIVPDITGMDEATKNRFCMIPFEGRWIRKDEDFDVPETHEGQVKAKTYWMDERFEENIPRLASALLWLAIKYYKIYRKEGLIAPKYIKDWMREYWTKHDPHISFITEMLENPKVKVPCESCDGDDTVTIEIDGMEETEGVCQCCDGTGMIEKIDTSKSVTATEIYPIYRKWFRETYPQVQVVPKPRMTEILSTPDKLGKQKNRKWYGVTVRRHQPVEIAE